MKPFYAQFAGALTLTFAIAACVPQPRNAPPPAQPSATPSPVASPLPEPSPVYANWMDAPQTPGDWTYRAVGTGSSALFGSTGSESRFTLNCLRPQRTIVLSLGGRITAPTTMTIRTESVTRSLAATPANEQLPLIEARLPAADALLDAMALSKGRFAVEVPGQPPLYLPSWAEVTRVIEDCR